MPHDNDSDNDIFEPDGISLSEDDNEEIEDSCFENSVTLVGKLYYSGDLKIKETSRGYVAAFQLHIEKKHQNKTRTHRIYVKAYKESTIHAIEELASGTIVKVFGYVESSGNNTCINAKSVVPVEIHPIKQKPSRELSESNSAILAKIEEKLAKVIEQGERIVKSKGGVVFDQIEDEDISVIHEEVASWITGNSTSSSGNGEKDDNVLKLNRPKQIKLNTLASIDENMQEPSNKEEPLNTNESDPSFLSSSDIPEEYESRKDLKKEREERSRRSMEQIHQEIERKKEKILPRVSEEDGDHKPKERKEPPEEKGRDRRERREEPQPPPKQTENSDQKVEERQKKKFLSGWQESSKYESQW